MKNILAFVIAGASAYSFSFAIDLLVAGLLGVYPSTAFLPVVTWSIIAAVTGIVALRLAPTGRFLVVPFFALTALALFGGVVGHRYSLIVGILLLAEAVGVWFATAQAKKTNLPK